MHAMIIRVILLLQMALERKFKLYYFKDYTDTKGKNSVAPNLELTKWMWKSYRRFKLTVNMLLNILVNILDINDANDVIKTGDVTKNIALCSLAP